MPTPMDAMLGLVIVAMGLVTVVLAFMIVEPQKRFISYGISCVLIIAGLYYYVGSEMRGFQMRRRIADIQRQQQVNLEEIQKKLKEAPTQPGKIETPPARPR